MMSKSKKNSQNKNKTNGAQNCENNMKYATDKQQGSASDCHDNRCENKNESNCR